MTASPATGHCFGVGHGTRPEDYAVKAAIFTASTVT